MLKYGNNWGGLTPVNKKYMDEKWGEYGCSRGKCDSVGGEIIRAINRICYRFYNDGDTVERYYGSSSNFSWACDDYLSKHVTGYESMRGIFFDERFEDVLSRNMNNIAVFLKNHESLFTEKNREDCLANAPLSVWDGEDNDDWDDEDW